MLYFCQARFCHNIAVVSMQSKGQVVVIPILFKGRGRYGRLTLEQNSSKDMPKIFRHWLFPHMLRAGFLYVTRYTHTGRHSRLERWSFFKDRGVAAVGGIGQKLLENSPALFLCSLLARLCRPGPCQTAYQNQSSHGSKKRTDKTVGVD
jgi:hypothetical protein